MNLLGLPAPKMVDALLCLYFCVFDSLSLSSHCYLIPFPPGVILQSIEGKFLRAAHYKVDEVPASC